MDFKIYLRLSSKAMPDKEKQKAGQKEFETYQHTCNFSGKKCPLHRHHHIKSGLRSFLGGGDGRGIFLVVRLVPYQTSHLKMLAIILMIKQMPILLMQKHAYLLKVSK